MSVISNYISRLSMDAPLVEGQGVVKKVVLNFAVKLWWLLVCYQLFTTAKISYILGAVLY